MSLPPRARLSLHTCPIGLVLALACSVRGLDPGAGDAPAETTTTGAPDPTAPLPDPTTAAPDPSTTDPGDTAADSSAGFIGKLDLPGSILCDAWLQDCPEGQKCAAVSFDSNPSVEGLRCVPVVADPDGLNQLCTDLGAVSDGLDTCAEGQVCWSVDPATKIGVCRGLCAGGPDEPICADPDAACKLLEDGFLPLCQPPCDPLAPGCPAGELCVYDQSDGQSFFCVHDPGGAEGQVFDLCEHPHACDPGLLCLDSALADECDPHAAGCCLPVCDLDLPPSCPGEGQECLPWYVMGAPPPGSEDIGVCGLPL